MAPFGLAQRYRLLAPTTVAVAVALGVYVYVAWISRPAEQASEQPAGRVDAIARVAGTSGRPVIFIGLDGGDWELLDRYIAAGAMPNLAALVREGTSGVLDTIHPPLSPLVWTTMMTGVSPVRHRILDFVRYHPTSGGKEPITSDERKAPAIWNMATYAGRSVATLGLWATYPAEPVAGTVVSDRLFSFLYTKAAPAAGVIYPPSRDGWARDALARAEAATGLAALQRFLPWLDAGEYQARAAATDPYTHPVSALRRILVETSVYDTLARDVIQRDKPDLTIVYVQGTDSIGHVFAPYAPPRQPAIPFEDFDRYSGVPERYFRHIDEMLGEYRRLAQANGAALFLASDHGFLWSEGRPTAVSSVANATAAKWHRREGMYVLWGPGIPATGASPARTARGSVNEVTATLLALLDLPAAQGSEQTTLPGTPARAQRPKAGGRGPGAGGRGPEAGGGRQEAGGGRQEAGGGRQEGGAPTAVDYAAHYHPAPPAPAPSADEKRVVDEEAIAKLRALGYIGAAEGSSKERPPAGTTRSAASFNNEGLVLRAEGRPEEALKAFDAALAVDPQHAAAAWNLSDTLFLLKREADRSDDLLVRAFALGVPDGTRFLVERAIGYQRGGQIDRSLALMNKAIGARADDPEVWLFRGRYRIEREDCRGALADFENAARLAPSNPAAFASQGVALMCLGDKAGARRAFTRALELDPNQPLVRRYLR